MNCTTARRPPFVPRRQAASWLLAVGGVLAAGGAARAEQAAGPASSAAPPRTAPPSTAPSPPAPPVVETPSALENDPQGWKDILPDSRLTGWTRYPLRTQVQEKLPIWKVDRKAGLLTCQADLPLVAPPGRSGTHEMLRYDRELGDFVWHVEWRFVDPEKRGWNSGIYARIAPDRRFWYQAQVGNASGGHWFGYIPDGPDGMLRESLSPRGQRVKPVGEWNSYEITARGDTLTLWVNGAVTSQWKPIAILRGHIGLEGEFHRIEFRNMKLKELTADQAAGPGPAPATAGASAATR
jgi:hypothetical protein